ncbi:MAG: PLD nuclease N-terminal domain-containing protein [Sedimentisphaerales bacterium]
MPWYAFSGLYLVIWSALLIHCLFRREFYPIFGRRWGTKGLWLLTFVFLNPLLTLIYFIFGFLLCPPKAKADERGGSSQTVPIGLGSAVAIALIGVVLVFFEWPLSRSKRSESIVLRSATQNEARSTQHDVKFQAHIGTINARNNIQTLSSTSAGSGARVSMRNILIICQSPHDLLDRTMREFQKSLVQLPYVDEVAYYPFGTWPKPGGLLPDVFITINMPQVNEKSFLRSRNFKAIIKWTAGSSIFAGTSHSDQTYTLPVVRFDIESLLEHESKMFGIESSQAKYKLAANGICSEMIKSISKQFGNLLDKYGRMPESPEMLHGVYHEPPELSFLKADKVQQLISGSGLLKNNHTVWRFADERQIDKALMAYRDELKTLGWGQEDLGKEYLRIQKGNEHIYIFRQSRRDSKAGKIFWSEPEKIASEVSLIADYESDFTDDQMQKAMDALLDSDVEMKTLLIFEKYFRTPEQLEHLRSIIDESPVNTLDGCLMLARYWADRGETDKGRESLLRARAMQRTEKDHNVRADEIKSLAGKLGDVSLAEVPVAEEIFRQMGFINPEQLNEPVEIERPINEPVLFYRRLGDGELQTFALRIIRSQESSYLAPYHLLTVESRKGSSSSSENGGKVKPGGIWVVDTSINALTDESKSIQLQVKSLGNEHFLFAITP